VGRNGDLVAPVCSNCGASDFVWANELKTGSMGGGALSLRSRGELPMGTRICRSCGHADLFLRDPSILRMPHTWKPGEFVPIAPREAASTPSTPSPASPPAPAVHHAQPAVPPSLPPAVPAPTPVTPSPPSPPPPEYQSPPSAPASEYEMSPTPDAAPEAAQAKRARRRNRARAGEEAPPPPPPPSA
jgi:hypothetical protein